MSADVVAPAAGRSGGFSCNYDPGTDWHWFLDVYID